MFARKIEVSIVEDWAPKITNDAETKVRDSRGLEDTDTNQRIEWLKIGNA